MKIRIIRIISEHSQWIDTFSAQKNFYLDMSYFQLPVLKNCWIVSATICCLFFLAESPGKSGCGKQKFFNFFLKLQKMNDACICQRYWHKSWEINFLLTYTGQWLTDIVTKHLFFKKKNLYGNIYDIYRTMTDWHCDQTFFSKKKFVWETIDLTDIVTKVYLINIYDIYRTMTDWHCDQTFFFKKKFVMGNHWLDWHCDQGIFNKHLWHIQDNDWLTLWPNIFFCMGNKKKKICMGNHWLDWHCDQGIFNKHLWHIQDNDWLTLWPNIFFKKKNLYGKPLTWLTLWPRYI